MNIKHFDSEYDIKECFELIKVLRPKLECVTEFYKQVLRQQSESYRLIGIVVDKKIVALAGYREQENLIHGKFIYVDDLVTDPKGRGKKFGEKLLEEIASIAREKGKDKVVLDTGLANNRAQKFYYRVGYVAIGMHFYYEIK